MLRLMLKLIITIFFSIGVLFKVLFLFMISNNMDKIKRYFAEGVSELFDFWNIDYNIVYNKVTKNSKIEKIKRTE